jgi:hypothetical protein
MLVTLSRAFDPSEMPDLCNIDPDLDRLEGRRHGHSMLAFVKRARTKADGFVWMRARMPRSRGWLDRSSIPSS